jgi:hypothetical protein
MVARDVPAVSAGYPLIDANPCPMLAHRQAARYCGSAIQKCAPIAP